MQQAGIRGIRLNLATGGVNDPNVGRAALLGRGRPHQGAQLARPDVHQPADDLRDQGPRRRLAGAGRVRPFRRRAGRARRRSSRALPTSLELVKSGKAYVKISGAYRASKLAPDYPDVVPLAKALIAANPDRIVWGTDWPHPDSVTPPGKKADRRRRRCSRSTTAGCSTSLPVWAPDAAIRKKILVDNPGAALRLLTAVSAPAARSRRSAPAASRGSRAAPASCR